MNKKKQRQALRLLWDIRSWLIGPDYGLKNWSFESQALYTNSRFLEDGKMLVDAIDKLVWVDPNHIHPLIIEDK